MLLNETLTEIQLVDLALLTPLRGAGIGASIVEQLQTYAGRARPSAAALGRIRKTRQSTVVRTALAS